MGSNPERLITLLKETKETLFFLALESKVKHQWPASQEGSFYKKANLAGSLTLDVSAFYTKKQNVCCLSCLLQSIYYGNLFIMRQTHVLTTHWLAISVWIKQSPHSP